MTRHFLLCPLGTDPTLVRRCTCDPTRLAAALKREAEAVKPKPVPNG